jgi:hypothetical protein
MKSFLHLFLTLSLGGFGVLNAASASPNSLLPRSTPEAQGISSAALLAFIEAADNIEGMHSFRFIADTTQRDLEVIWQSAGIEHRVACGFREWKKGEASWGNAGTKESMAASGAWTLPDTYVMKQCFTQTPYHLTTKFRFEDDRVFVDEETNVAFGSTKRPQLVGRAE